MNNRLKIKTFGDKNATSTTYVVLCTSRPNSKILKNEMDPEITGLTDWEKDYRITLSKKSGGRE
jgi:hypothetical protein